MPLLRTQQQAEAFYWTTWLLHAGSAHLAASTLGHPLPLELSLVGEQDGAHVETLSEKTQIGADGAVQKAFVDQGYTGAAAAEAAAEHGIELEVVKAEGVKGGFVLLPRRWVVERTHAWAARFRRLARDYERLEKVLAAAHFVAYSMVLLQRLVPHLSRST